MKKKILTAMLIASLVCAAASCGGNQPASTTAAKTSASETTSAAATEETPAPAAADFSASDVTKAVLDEVPINSAFEKKAETLPNYFDGLDTDAIKDFSYFICASGAYPDEIAVFLFNSEDSAKSAVKAVEDRLAYQTETYESYTPDEMYKIENAVIQQTGKWVYYLVTSDNEKADSIVKGFIS